MLAEQRRIKILELIREEGSAKVKELSALFSVSSQTIRQDLEILSRSEPIVRDYGGAYLKSIPRQVLSLTLQHSENMDIKKTIAREAVRHVHDRESLILDCGSTVTEIARLLTQKAELKIITNALNIALIIGSIPGFELLVSGGMFKPPTLSLTGEKAEEFFTQIHVDTLFLATGGISNDYHLTYPGLNDLPIKRAMLKAAGRTFLVADSTKFHKPSLLSLGSIDMVDALITDEDIGAEDAKKIEDLGVEIIIARANKPEA